MNGFDINMIDKSKWKKYPFEQIAFSISKRVEPKDTELEIYVGLEHLDAESVHIKRTGVPSDVEGTKLLVYPGDVIFGKRRAYQRKAAIATFEGICSAHAMVLRANEKVIDKSLFPFFLHSDYFMHRAIDISVGSLSPTINWGTLKTQEFLLPPKDQQTKLAELLWAADEVVQKEQSLVNELGNFLEVKLNVLLSKYTDSIILGELGEFIKGKGISKNETLNNGIPCVRYGELYTRHDKIVRKFYSFIEPETAKKSIKLYYNDLIFAGSGETIEEIGKSAAIIHNIEAFAGGDTIIFRPYNSDGAYLGYLMNSHVIRKQLNRLGKGATIMHIYANDLKQVLLPKIDRKEQEIISNHLESIYKKKENAQYIVNSTKQIQKQIVNQIFST